MTDEQPPAKKATAKKSAAAKGTAKKVEPKKVAAKKVQPSRPVEHVRRRRPGYKLVNGGWVRDRGE